MFNVFSWYSELDWQQTRNWEDGCSCGWTLKLSTYFKSPTVHLKPGIIANHKFTGGILQGFRVSDATSWTLNSTEKLCQIGSMLSKSACKQSTILPWRATVFMLSWTRIFFACRLLATSSSWLHILVSVHWWTRSPCGCEIFIRNPVARLNFLASVWSLVGAMVWPLSFQVLGMWCMVFCIWWLRKRNLDWTTPKVPMKSWKRKWKQEPLLQFFQQIHTVARNLQECVCFGLVNDYTQKYRSAMASVRQECKLWHFFVPWHVENVAWRCLPEEMVSSSHALWTLCVLTWQVSPARLYHQNVIWPWWLRGRLNTTYRRHGLRLGAICWWICCQTKDWIMEHVIMCNDMYHFA